MAITLHQIRIFWAVAQARSFTKASKLLGLAQPSLSQQIAKLEEEIGTQLFIRGHANMTLTEAGSFLSGSIKSSIGLGILLLDGIGDTIRVSLSDDPVKEIKIGNEILKSLNLRNRGVKIISCPSCARQAFHVIDTVKMLEDKLSHIKTPITLSVIGCVVNGPGEAASSDIGITGGGKGSNMLYLSGIQTEKILTKEIISKVVHLVEKKASEIRNKQ